MVPKLKAFGADVMQFKFDPRRPDLTKLDSLFGLLSSEHQESFEEEVKNMETEVKLQGVQKFFESLVMDCEVNNSKKAPENEGGSSNTQNTPTLSTAVPTPTLAADHKGECNN